MKFTHTAQKYRPLAALFGCPWIIEVGLMEIAKASLDSQKIANARLKFSLLVVLAWVFAFIIADFIVRAPMRLIRDICVPKELRLDSINAAKFYRALQSLNLKFSPQNLIAPNFGADCAKSSAPYIVAAAKILIRAVLPR